MTGPGTVAVRTERPGDVAHTQDVVAAGFGDAVIPALLADLRLRRLARSVVRGRAVRRGGGSRVLHARLAGRAGPVAGGAGAQPAVGDADPSAKGVGSQLVRRSLAVLRDRPEPLVFLEGSPGYYARFGFRAGTAGGFGAPSDRIPDAAFQFIPLARHDPSMTGRLVYPDVFWRHDAVGLRT